MTRRPLAPASAAFVALSLGCGGTEPSPPPAPPPGPPAVELSCGDGPFEVTLGPGQSAVLDAGQSAGCVRFPSGPEAREYLVVAYSAADAVVPGGANTPYRWRTRSASAPSAVAGPPATAATEPASLHDAIRASERSLHVDRRRPLAVAAAQPPALGERRSFGVCADLGCETFTPVPSTANYVGRKVAIFLDDALPPGGFQPADVARLGRLFDDYLYPIDTTAFGRESDVDGNGVVFAVITRAVNDLCPGAGGVVTGYFYGLDLLTGQPGSNGAEVFYALAPDPNGVTGCRVTPEFVERTIPGTFIHEFQHMISFNQHRLIRGGEPEETWLAEGLSHFAEELGGRRIPDALCLIQDCLSQLAFNDVSNAYRYLFSPEDFHLVYPAGSSGRLAERGASWLFTRWLADHFGGDQVTRSLVMTDRTGAANVGAAAGVGFDRLLGEWHLANYLDDLEGFTPASSRLGYPSWSWRGTFPQLRAQYPSLYPRSFPLVADSSGGSFDRTGTLRGGSGRHLRVVIQPGQQPVDLRLDGPDGAALPASIAGRIAVARIR